MCACVCMIVFVSREIVGEKKGQKEKGEEKNVRVCF